LLSKLFIKQSVRNSPPIGEVATALCCKQNRDMSRQKDPSISQISNINAEYNET